MIIENKIKLQTIIKNLRNLLKQKKKIFNS